MKRLRGLVILALLTSCSASSTGFTASVKFEHGVEAPYKASQDSSFSAALKV